MSFLHYVLFVAALFFVIAPGVYLAASLRALRNIPDNLLLAWGITLDAVIGYCVFWTYFLHPFAGRVSSWIVFALGGAAALHFALSRTLRERLLKPDVLYPLALMLLAGISYISILYAVPQSVPHIGLANIRFFPGLPGDNVIPKAFADCLHAGMYPDIHTVGWRSSDRPPLQSGIYLAMYPLERFCNYSGFPYVAVGVIAQCFWIPALWSLCRVFRLSSKTIAFVFFACVFSGFFLLNSVFVWPKLLSAALAAIALTIAVKPIDGNATLAWQELCLASTAGALGMLSHAGVAFTYPAMALIALQRGFAKNFKRVGVAAAVFMVWMLPWSAYQKYYDPPGNRLAKWHLAGAIEIDDRTFFEALRDGYSKLTLNEFADVKWENTKTLVGPNTTPKSFVWPDRVDQFYYLVKTFGLLNIGWLVLGGIFISRRKLDAEGELGARLLLIGALSVLLWVLALYNPGSTLVPGGSYATVLFMYLALVIFLAKLPSWLSVPLLLAQFANFMEMWIVNGNPAGSPLDPRMLGVAIVCWSGIVYLLYRLTSCNVR